MTITAFFCGHNHAPICCVLGCWKKSHNRCGFELSGKKAGQICGKPVCPDHDGNDPVIAICPPHQRLVEKRASG